MGLQTLGPHLLLRSCPPEVRPEHVARKGREHRGRTKNAPRARPCQRTRLQRRVREQRRLWFQSKHIRCQLLLLSSRIDKSGSRACVRNYLLRVIIYLSSSLHNVPLFIALPYFTSEK